MNRNPRVVLIGGGINALVAANYLRREGGFEVTILERKEKVGGACIRDLKVIDGKVLVYPTGATVLGLMQKFVFEECGLAQRIQTYAPNYGKVIFFEPQEGSFHIHRDPMLLTSELFSTMGERGDVEGFRQDEARVVAYLQKGYRDARVPTFESAVQELGPEIVERWITGNAKDLLEHYFTSEMARVYMGMTVTESGPTSYRAPYSAFTIPLYDSGSVFDGYWGYVQGGIGIITETLGRINQALGVNIVTSAEVLEVAPQSGIIRYRTENRETIFHADRIVFGTDPLTAAKLVGQRHVVEETKFLGSSGKLVLAFQNPVRWKDATNHPDAASAFRFIFAVDTLAELEANSRSVARGATDFAPGYIQLYSEGAAQRRMGMTPVFDLVIAFFKNLTFGKRGDELPEVREYVRDAVLRRVHNPEDLVWDHLLSPKDLQEMFFFPKGHIEHTEITTGQQAWQRTFSTDPETCFYRFGNLENVFMCGAGVYPCGSVHGTGGYMCAKEIMRTIGA